jgi:hypothetical protein
MSPDGRETAAARRRRDPRPRYSRRDRSSTRSSRSAAARCTSPYAGSTTASSPTSGPCRST